MKPLNLMPISRQETLVKEAFVMLPDQSVHLKQDFLIRTKFLGITINTKRRKKLVRKE